MYNKEIVDKTKRYFRKYKNLIEMSMINYEGLNYYIRLDKHPKLDIYYLRSINMNLVEKFDKTLINQEILLDQPVGVIFDILNKVNVDKYDYSNTLDADYICFNDNINNKEYKFNLFLPYNWTFLADVIFILFSNMPMRLENIFNEMTASLSHQEIKYTYKKPFKFDLMKGDLTKVFSDKEIKEGTAYYQDNRVRFLEKINNSYYATIEGNNNNLYTVIFDYEPKDKMIRMGCNCPCEFFCKHMYATMLSVRNKEQYKYYKVRYIDEHSETMYDKLFTLNYFLCIGIDRDKLILVYPNGQIQSVFILDADGCSMFEVVEDDENKTLTNYINEIKKS